MYHPPAGVTPKRMAIIHLFGGGFRSGNKNAGYIVNDVRALGRLGYTNISANYRLQTEGSWPAQIHDTKAAIRWVRANAAKIGIDANKIAVAGYSAGGMLSLLAAGTNGMAEFEGNGGNSSVSSNVQAGIGVYPLASAQTAAALFEPVRRRAHTAMRAARRRHTSERTSRRRSSSTAPATQQCRCRRASTSSISSMTPVPTALTSSSGGPRAITAHLTPSGHGAPIDVFLDRLIVNSAVPELRWRGADAVGADAVQDAAVRRRRSQD
jgi:pectinesterase